MAKNASSFWSRITQFLKTRHASRSVTEDGVHFSVLNLNCLIQTYRDWTLSCMISNSIASEPAFYFLKAQLIGIIGIDCHQTNSKWASRLSRRSGSSK